MLFGLIIVSAPLFQQKEFPIANIPHLFQYSSLKMAGIVLGFIH